MGSMKRLSIWTGAVMWAVLAATAASGQQMIPPGWSPFNPPPPAAPPPPRMDVPEVPRMDVPSQPPAPAVRRESYGDRITRCLEEGAAAGLGPSRREAYSRACANR
jgi:hypothetical protein